MDNISINVTAIIQKRRFGVKKPNSDSLDTMTAKALKKAFARLGVQFDDSKSKEHTAETPVEKTTTSFTLEVDSNQAIRLVNDMGAVKFSADYLKKRDAYLSQKNVVKQQIDVDHLEGKGKLAYYNRMKPFVFHYYTTKLLVKVMVEGESKPAAEARTKTYFSLMPISEKMIKDKLVKYTRQLEDEESEVNSAQNESNPT